MSGSRSRAVVLGALAASLIIEGRTSLDRIEQVMPPVQRSTIERVRSGSGGVIYTPNGERERARRMRQAERKAAKQP